MKVVSNLHVDMNFTVEEGRASLQTTMYIHVLINFGAICRPYLKLLGNYMYSA